MKTHDAPEVRGGHSIGGWRRILAFAAISLALTPTIVHGSEGLAPWPGRPLPPFSLESHEGKAVALADYRGAPLLIHAFATWCVPCRRELPALARLASRFSPSQLKILAISIGEPDVRVRRFLETMPLPFPVLLDRQRAVARAWGVDVLPTTILLDARLQPRLFVEGELDWDGEAAAAAIGSLAISTDDRHAQTPPQEDTP